MVVRSSFFNSVGGDRIYDASNFASYFASFIGNGVFPNPSTNLQVLQSSNLTIRVAPGKGFINGYYVENTADLSLQIGIANGVSARIDRIVMGLNLSNRQVTIYVKAGTAASNPVAPALVRNGTIHELALADVNVARGATSITQANIVDQRMNASLCGIVSGVVNQVDTTTLYNQYQAAFNQFSTQQQRDFQTFLDGIEAQLDGNTAGNLQNQINTKANIDSPAFTGNPTTPDIPNNSASTQLPNAAFVRRVANEYVTDVTQGTGSQAYLKIGQLNTNVPSLPSRLAIILDGLGDLGLNVFDSAYITASAKSPLTLRVKYFNDSQTVSRGIIRFGYVNNTATNMMEIWVRLPAYNFTIRSVKLGVSNAQYDLITKVTAEPSGIVYVTPQTFATDLALVNKADINSPVFTGTPTAPTPPTNDFSTKIATTAYTRTEINTTVGALSQLPTNNKTSIVGAINELNAIKLSTRTTLASGTNLNNLRTDGLYTGSNLTNAPLLSIATLEVKVYSSDWIVQSITHIPGTGIFRSFERVYYNGNTWSAWRETGATGDLTSLLTTEKTNLVGSINELFTSVSNGKNSIATAITSKGVPAQGSDTFAQLSTKISNIEQGIRYATGIANVSTTTLSFNRAAPTAVSGNRLHLTVSGLNFTPARIVITGPTEDYIVEYNGTYRLANRNIIISSFSATEPFEVYGASGSAYVNGTGFRLPVAAIAQGGAGVRWHAYAQ